MNAQDKEDLTEVLHRLERIEKAILGDETHGVWGYKKKLEHYIEKLSELETKKLHELDMKMNRQYETLSKRIMENHDEITKRKGIESTIAVISTIVGGLVGAVFTLVLTGGL